MRSKTIGLTAAILSFAAASIVRGAASAGSDSSGTYPIVQIINEDVRRIRLSPEVTVEQLHGKSAVAHLQSLMARRPEAFRKSTALLQAKGRVPTQEVFIERTLHTKLGKLGGGVASPYSLMQSGGESSQDGEIAFWSWDGPGYTWQGTIYMEVYGYGAATWDGEIDTDSSEYPWNWVDHTWSSPDCAPNCGPENQTRLRPLHPGDMTHGAVQLASLRTSGDYKLVTWNQWYNWSTCFRAAVITGCTAAAVGCIRVRAAWPACFALWCVGTELGAGLGCAFYP